MNLLTTVIPVYNGESYIRETLASVARQTRRPDRLIVLDNCSTDGTRAVVEQFRKVGCEWHQNEKNLGLFGNLNRALNFSDQTKYLHLLHADDLMKPEFYQKYLAAAESRSGRGMIFGPVDFINELGQSTGSEAMLASSDLAELNLSRFLVMRAELRPIYFPSVLLKTAGMASPCWFRMDMPQLADQVFWAEWATHSSWIIYLPEALSQYRVHVSSGTNRNISKLSAWVMDEWRAMQLVAKMQSSKGLVSWVRECRLRCIFAARSQVKIRQVEGVSPAFAQAIRQAVRAKVSAPYWILARIAVWLRNTRAHCS